MTTATKTLWGLIVERAKLAWSETNRKPNPIFEKFYRSEKLSSGIIAALIEMVFMAVLVSLTGYITTQMFINFASPREWLIYQIAWIYGITCRQGYCSLPYLNAGLVVAMELIALFTIFLWRSINYIGIVSDMDELHLHMDLISDQIKYDYDGLGMIQKRMDAMETALEESDKRVDIVVEYQPAAQADVTSEEEYEPEPTASAA